MHPSRPRPEGPASFRGICPDDRGPSIRAAALAARATKPVTHPLWAIYGALGLCLTGFLASMLLRSNGEHWLWLDGWGVCAIEVVASGLCIARGFARRSGQSAAFVLGASLLSWTLGDIVLTVESLGNATPPTPSLADAFYLGFYPLAYIAVMLFMRSEVKKLTVPNWLDGCIAGLGAASVCAAFAFHDILKSSGSNTAATITNLAYPIGDVLLLGLVVGGFAVLSGKRKTPWILLAGGLALNVVGDTSNLLQNSLGASRAGIILNAVAWPTAIVVMSMAVWLRQRPTNLLAPQKQAGFFLPNLAAMAALIILFSGTIYSIGRVAILLATATLIVVGIRLALSVGAMQTISLERHKQAVTDHLTGLHNRRHLFRVLDTFFSEREARGTDRSLAFLFVDFNHFKEINDSFGHPAGDQLLKQLGTRLTDCLRETDLLVRLGGDEFAVVLIDGRLEEAVAVAERLTECMAQPFALDMVNASITASIGIAMAPEDATDSAGILWCADVAMYRAKLSNSPYACYEQTLDVESDQMRLLEELRAAIDENHLVLHYQPQLDLRSGKILAVEALLRWAHPRLGLVPPIKFIPLAEEAGLMQAITTWVIEEAAAQCAAWRAAGNPVTVSVNVSPSNLLDPGFVNLLRGQLQLHSLPATSLVVEITETCVITEFDTARTVIQELRDLGIVVSIDDFGAGATSLAYLSNLAVGELKLDRGFVAGLVGGGTDRDLDVVRSTIDLGHAVGLRIVAEGIEDSATLTLLSSLGCDFAQGYCISKPKPASELAFRYEDNYRPTRVDPRLDDLPASA